MVYNTESLTSRTMPIVRNPKQLESTVFRKLDLFPSSAEGRQTPTLSGPSEGANLNHWSSDRG
jgi:hypothetical protein